MARDPWTASFWALNAALVGAMIYTGCSAGGGGAKTNGGPGGNGASGGAAASGGGGTVGGGGGGAGGGGGIGGLGGLGGEAGGGGTGALDPDAACTGVFEKTEETFGPADVIVAVDTSGSMDLEAMWTQNNMPVFANTITNSGVDVHVVMISSTDICVPTPLGSGSCPNDTNPPNYLHVQQGVGSNNALNKIIDTFPEWKPMIRASSSKSFLVVTDDDATDGPNNSAGAFINSVNNLDPSLIKPDQWKFHGIFASQGFLIPPCVAISAAEGKVYKDLVIQTGGVSGDLCLQDFAPVFNQLAVAVISSTPLACEWAIPPPADGGTIDPNLVNVVFTGQGSQTTLGYVQSMADCATSQNGWYYDDNANPTKVFACPDTCNLIHGQGAVSVEIQFGCSRTPAIPK